MPRAPTSPPGDGDTVSTAELLDLIQADVLGGGRSGGGVGGARSSGGARDVSRKDPFSVRLAPQPHTRRRARPISPTPKGSDDDSGSNGPGSEDEDSLGDISGFTAYKKYSGRKSSSRMKQRTNKKEGGRRRQRMPLGGGYGGMFEEHNAGKHNNIETGASSIEGGSVSELSRGIRSQGDESSGVNSIFSLASRMFSRQRHRNPYSGVRSVSSHSTRHHKDNSFLLRLSAHYLELPFQLRYFVQLFAIMGVLMLASLNYFIAVDDQPPAHRHTQQNQQQRPFQQPSNILEGGGASPNNVPRLRVRDPLKFLHPDARSGLLESATAKFRHSNRYSESTGVGGKDGEQAGGPFQLGWRSMPRQIYNFVTPMENEAEREEAEHPMDEDDVRIPAKGTVAWVLPITTCYPDEGENADQSTRPRSPNPDETSFRDFAMMLRAMIHAHSHRNPASGSSYDYEMHALLHPRATKCRSTKDLFAVRGGNGAGDVDNDAGGVVDRTVVLQNLGYKVSTKYPPVNASKVQGSEFLREHLQNDPGQLADLIRLHAYEMEGYAAVVLVDYDTLVLGPVDKAVDLIFDSKDTEGSIDAVFSWKHLPSLVDPKAKASVINLSFFLLRPSKSTFNKLVLQYQNGPFSETRGWGATGRGSFPGWMATHGLLTYYYDEVASASRVEMSRCIFGNTGEEYDSKTTVLITNSGSVQCGGENSNQCEDCRGSKMEDVRVANLSYCRAPWECGGGDDNDEDADRASAADELSGLCQRFRRAWFDGRLQMEDVHPQLEKGSGQLCVDGDYQPMTLLKPNVGYKPRFLEE